MKINQFVEADIPAMNRVSGHFVGGVKPRLDVQCLMRSRIGPYHAIVGALLSVPGNKHFRSPRGVFWCCQEVTGEISCGGD